MRVCDISMRERVDLLAMRTRASVFILYADPHDLP